MNKQFAEFEEMMAYRPSVIRNSFLVTLVRVAFGLLSPLFIFCGVACLVGSSCQEYFFLTPMVKTDLITQNVADQLKDNTTLLGVLLLFIGSLGFVVIWLCRKLIERNWFLMELESWREERKEMKLVND